MVQNVDFRALGLGFRVVQTIGLRVQGASEYGRVEGLGLRWGALGSGLGGSGYRLVHRFRVLGLFWV